MKNNWPWYITLVGQNLRVLTFVHDSAKRQVNQIHAKPFQTKDQMKLVGATATEFSWKMAEFHVLGMAKTIEDLLWAFEDAEGRKLDFWKDLKDYPYRAEAVLVRRLANVVKHHGGLILASNKNDATQLINENGFDDETPVGQWAAGHSGHGGGPAYAPLNLLYCVQEFCFSIIERECELKSLRSDWPEEQIEEKMVERWLGEFKEMDAA